MMLGNLLILCLMFLHVSAAPGPKPDTNVNIDINVNGNSVSDGGDTDETNIKCGIETPYANRIINGEPVNAARKYSWQVFITDYQFLCGGSVITNKHILTAAHCFFQKNKNGTTIKINKVFTGIGTNKRDLSSIVIPSANIYIHEDYNPINPLLSHMHFDIAIIELSKPIELVKNGIVPICMPMYSLCDYAGLNATITGWGSTVGYNYIPTPRPKPHYPYILQEAQVPVLDNDKCRQIVRKYGKLYYSSIQICAGGLVGFENNGTSTCQGDSGGPLTVQSNGQQHQQIGLVSYAFGCASKGNPTVYTRVTGFIDWIKEKVKPEMIYTAK